MMVDTVCHVETPEGVDISLRAAGPVVRGAAWLLDLFIRILVVLVVAAALGSLGKFGSGAMLLLLFAIEWIYPVIFEVWAAGMTPGKRAMGIAVVRDDGTPVDWASSLIRNILRTADMLPGMFGFALISMVCSRGFRRLGDLAAGTLVVYVRHERQGWNSAWDTSRDLHRQASRPDSEPQLNPRPPRFPLRLEEQRALIDFAFRARHMSAARAEEIAKLVADALAGAVESTREPLTAANGSIPDANSAVARLRAVAAWLQGAGANRRPQTAVARGATQ